ncbi:MAG: ABC transporter ATP-binding protein [Chloroflexota bacterium]
MLQVNNVEVRYQGVILVLRGVTLEIDQGHMVCLLGANGAGKSTTLKAISGLLYTEEGEVTDGSITFEGERIDHKHCQEIVARGIVLVPEGRKVLEHLTVEENLLAGALYRKDMDGIKNDLEKVYHYFPRLKELRQHTSGYCSGGELQMMVVGRGLMGHPKLMLLDEASMGLAPFLVREIYEIIRRLNAEERITMLVVEQNARAALEFCDYGYVMENGRVVMDGPAAKLRDNEDVKEFYMGLTEVGRKSYREVKHYRRRKRWLG